MNRSSESLIPTNPVAYRCRRVLAPLVLACVLSAGCIPVPRGDDPLDIEFMSREALRDYSERVFREHNRTVSRLMMSPAAGRSLDEDRVAELERAERRMNTACASLNRIASARARGQDPELELENRVRRDVRLCDQRTQQVARLLDELGIGESAPSTSTTDPQP